GRLLLQRPTRHFIKSCSRFYWGNYNRRIQNFSTAQRTGTRARRSIRALPPDYSWTWASRLLPMPSSSRKNWCDRGSFVGVQALPCVCNSGLKPVFHRAAFVIVAIIIVTSAGWTIAAPPQDKPTDAPRPSAAGAVEEVGPEIYYLPDESGKLRPVPGWT